MAKSWEKTVEWHFASDALRWLELVAPLDGTNEISDLITKANGIDWVLIEFKHSENDFLDEDKKYPSGSNKAMYSFLGKYFGCDLDFPYGNSSDADRKKLESYVKKIEEHPQLLGLVADLLKSIPNKIEVAKDNGIKTNSITTNQNNLELLNIYLKSKMGKNPVGALKSNSMALRERYFCETTDSEKKDEKNSESVSHIVDHLPTEEPHYIVFGKTISDEQHLYSLRYWGYKKNKEEQNNLAQLLAGKTAVFKFLKGAPQDKFLSYLNALSFSRGYLPDMDTSDEKIDGDDFDYFSAIGILKSGESTYTRVLNKIYKRKALVISGELQEIRKHIEKINHTLLARKVDLINKENIGLFDRLKKGWEKNHGPAATT